MDQIRVLLWAALLTMLWLGFSQWTEDYGAPPPPPALADELPAVDEGTLPTPTTSTGVTSGQGLPQAPDQDSVEAIVVGNGIRVVTDVLDVVIDPNGGDLVRADLPTYPVSKDEPDNLIRLLDYERANRWVFQTGVRDLRPGRIAMSSAAEMSSSSRSTGRTARA
jgi:YidC/Oxa1 family membrane protein insertase